MQQSKWNVTKICCTTFVVHWIIKCFSHFSSKDIKYLLVFKWFVNGDLGFRLLVEAKGSNVKMLLRVFEIVMKTFFWNCSDWMTKPLVIKLIIRLITHDPETVYQFLQFGLLICQHVTYSQLGWDSFWFTVMCKCGREYYTIWWAANGNCQDTPLSSAKIHLSTDMTVIWYIS